MKREDIKNLTLGELKDWLKEISQPLYRADQIFFWLYKKGVTDFNNMYNIPITFRGKLEKKYYISTVELSKHLKSIDGTEKFLFGLADGHFIESVLICAKNRATLCLSTQVGCKFACAFCASGLKKFVRNLTPAEMLNQILFLEHHQKHKITNIVFMGMGEPLDNYENLVKAIKIINNSKAIGLGARRITVSTCGIIPGIERFENLDLQVGLSISLHAANDHLRNELVPINKKYPLEKLIQACQNYIKKTRRRITLEYILIKDKNDSVEDADQLGRIAKKLKAKVNLIAYSLVPEFSFRPSTEDKITVFKSRLVKKGINVTMRESKGKDIAAACGQLAGRVK